MGKSFPGLLWAVAGTFEDLLCGGCCSSHRVTLASDFFQGLTQEPTLPPVLPDQPEPGVRTPPAFHSTCSAGGTPRNPSVSASQRDHQALQDLIDLAGEGLSASPWPCSGGLASLGETSGETLDGTPGQPRPLRPSPPCRPGCDRLVLAVL